MEDWAWERAETLRAYLDGLPRGAAGLPRRADFDPLAVPRAWPEMVLLHEEETGAFRFRYVGGEIASWSGLKLSFEAASAASLGPAHEDFVALYRRARETPAGLAFSGCLDWLGKQWVHFDQVLWPLADEADRPRWLVGVIRHRLADDDGGRPRFTRCVALDATARALGHKRASGG